MPSWLRPAIVVSLVAAAYLVWRPPSRIVWDDTSWASFNRHSNGEHYSLRNPRWFSDLLREAFGSVQIDGYRPLSAVIRGAGAAYFASPHANPWPFFCLTGVLLGLLSVTAFHVARKFTQMDIAAAAAVFLFLASTPMLTGSLVVFAGIQVLVPLLMCAAWLVYERSTTSRTPWRWRAALFALLLIGPWFREFTGVMPVLIIVRELQRTRKFTPTMALAGVGFLHAMFPTALVHFTQFPELPVVPVHRLGNLAAFLDRGEPATSWLRTVKQWHWRIWLDLGSILPPSLLVAGIGSLCVRLWGTRKPDAQGVPVPGGKWSDDLFLTIFFLATFLPFLKLFNEQVHLAYCLLPLSILLMRWLEFGWNAAAGRPALRLAGVIVVSIALLDQASNLYSVRGTTDAIYGAVDRLARWFRTHTPPGSVVICNAHHIEDIRYYSEGHIDLLATAPGVLDRSRWVETPEKLAQALESRRASPIYCLDVRLPAADGQRGADRAHFVVRGRMRSLKPVGRIDRVEFFYPFLDPLRHLTPLRTMSWPGPPDLEFDFYRGPPLSGGLFLREVSVDYELWRL